MIVADQVNRKVSGANDQLSKKTSFNRRGKTTEPPQHTSIVWFIATARLSIKEPTKSNICEASILVEAAKPWS
ncbi:Hypothetical protein P9303_11421 [Prochlorococcus marinus str. MIT 9303]|uniref:Uncharacterized protein n=1 Tax=Prochlorococcus marinus (strain MIT 9303) TaxID=59922 RepID=A2C8T1_PROM3|nr:Hypothetical protein P9303_11421 [Prochlorococcus marinus str. MIT 9303]